MQIVEVFMIGKRSMYINKTMYQICRIAGMKLAQKNPFPQLHQVPVSNLTVSKKTAKLFVTIPNKKAFSYYFSTTFSVLQCS